MKVQLSRIKGCQGVKVELPNANFLLIAAPKGYVMCGYLNMETAERLGDAACIVTGVKEFEDMLAAKVVKASAKAKELGIKEGMSGEAALSILST
jgi:uncharacterized protein YunC (DUF1805 family)